MSELRELYQEVILDHNKNPRNFHKLQNASHTAEGYNPLCGDHLFVHLHLQNGLIREISFEGNGCAISKASASIMTEVLTGKTIAQARELFERFHDLVTTEQEVDFDAEALGKLAIFGGVREFPVRVKCATLAWHTLVNALDEDKPDVISTE